MIPEGWKRTSLHDYIEIKHGFAFKSDYFSSEGKYIVMTPGHFFETGGFRGQGKKTKYYSGEIPDDYILSKGDVLIAMTEQAAGLLGSASHVPEDNKYLHNQRLGLLRSMQPDVVHQDFLYLIYNSPIVRKQIAQTASGTKVKHTSPDKLKEVVALIPPFLEQVTITNINSALEKTINITEKLLLTSQLKKKALMQQLLTGKKRFPEFVQSNEHDKTKYFEIPKDWKLRPIGIVGTHISKKNKKNEALPVLSCTKHRGLVDSLSYFGKRVFSENTSTYKKVSRGDFAYATNHIEEGSIGYQNLHDEALISPMYTVFHTNDSVYDPYLYKLFKTELFRHIFEANTNASVDRRGSLRWPDFSKIKIPLPSIGEQKRISEVIDAADEEIQLCGKRLENLKQQKKGLMQQLLTGKIRVKI